jgi:hypothetical protein
LELLTQPAKAGGYSLNYEGRRGEMKKSNIKVLAVATIGVALSIGSLGSQADGGKSSRIGREVKTVIANDLASSPSKSGGFMWADTAEVDTVHEVNGLAKQSAFQWGSVNQSNPTAAVDLTDDSRSLTAHQQGFRWGIKSSSEQNGFRWGIKSSVEQNGFRWGIKGSSEQSGFRWGIKSHSEQNGFRWGIKSSLVHQGFRWGIKAVERTQK